MTSRRLPAGWQQMPLEELVQPFPGHWGMDVQVDGLTPAQVLGVGNVLNDGNLDVQSAPVRYLAQSELECIALEGDLLVVKSSGSATNIRSGKTAICPLELTSRIACSNFMMLLRPAKGRVEPRWLWRYLNGHDAKTFVQLIAGSSTYPNIKWSSYKNLLVPVPPLYEQRRIVAKLDDQMTSLDRAEKALAEQAAMLDEMSIRVLHGSLAGTETRMWPLRSLGEVTTIVGGSTPSTGNPSFWNGQIVWITPADLGRLNDRYIHSSNKLITEAGLQSCSTQVVPVGSVVLSSRAPIGHLGIAGVPLCTNQGCKSFIPGSGVDSTYLYYSLKASVPLLQDLGSGATFKEVSKSDLSTFRVLVPSIQTQRRVSASLTAALDATSIAAFRLAQKRQGLIVLRSALLDAAFSGEV